MSTRLDIINSALAEKGLPDSVRMEVYKQVPGLLTEVCEGFKNVVATERLRQPLDDAAAADFRASVDGILEEKMSA